MSALGLGTLAVFGEVFYKSYGYGRAWTWLFYAPSPLPPVTAATPLLRCNTGDKGK
jgi:hypothetical protein